MFRYSLTTFGAVWLVFQGAVVCGEGPRIRLAESPREESPAISSEPVSAVQFERSNVRSEEEMIHLSDESSEEDFTISGCHCPGVCKDPGHPAKPKIKKPGDINRGKNPPHRYCLSECERAGDFNWVAPWAKCSMNEHYSAWYVGGGTPFFGRGRCSDEGTWGLDYALLKPKFVWLNWTLGRPQGGLGAYKTDGGPLSH